MTQAPTLGGVFWGLHLDNTGTVTLTGKAREGLDPAGAWDTGA